MFNKLRLFYWRLRLGSLGKNCFINGRITCDVPQNIFIGSNVSINEGVYLNGNAKLKIGDYVRISPFVLINTAGLDIRQNFRQRTHRKIPTTIEDGVWINSGAIINPGVTIGQNSTIGAGAVVTKNVPPNEFWVGIPARRSDFLTNKWYNQGS